RIDDFAPQSPGARLMTSSNSVTVQILDKEYSIICPQEERSNLVSAARYLDGKMREIRSSGKVIGADRIAVMAALNIPSSLSNAWLLDTIKDQLKIAAEA
ncbi:MAG: cell division protein ZapA, partial [Corynebacterium variabile]